MANMCDLLTEKEDTVEHFSMRFGTRVEQCNAFFYHLPEIKPGNNKRAINKCVCRIN